MVDALDIVSLERMRFELRFPDGDIEQDALLTEQIKSAVAFVATDTGVNLLGLAADDPRLASFTAPVIVIRRPPTAALTKPTYPDFAIILCVRLPSAPGVGLRGQLQG